MPILRMPRVPKSMSPAPPLEVLPNHWYAVLEAARLRERPVRVDRFGEGLVLYREKTGAVRCAFDRCPHRGVALSLGRVVGDELECPYHALRFAGDGACTAVPCDGPNARTRKALRLTTLPVCEESGLIWVWWGESRAELPEVPWIDEVPRSLAAASETSFVWPVPAVRATESVFDEHHAPVIHGRGLMRPMSTMRRFDELQTKIDGDLLEFTGRMRDEGDPPPPDAKASPFRVVLRQPGVVFLRINAWTNILSIDTPIDQHTTWRYVRYLSPWGRLRGFGKALAWALLRFDVRFIQQAEDLPMVLSVNHPETGHRDTFVAADVGIGRYRRMRATALNDAAKHADAFPVWVRRLLPSSSAEPA